jgi:tRNA-Thr(GGU) m(6)t(6)A37 methyltransferase TsaA
VNKSARIEISPVGFVQNRFNTPAAKSEQMRREKSKIILLPDYAEGLYRIEEHRYLEVIFHLNRSEGFSLKCKTPHWGIKGVFACRSPYRPSSLGLTRVKLISVNRNVLIVEGLDALNGTPVLDIKPSGDFLKSEKEINRYGKQKRPKKGN